MMFIPSLVKISEIVQKLIGAANTDVRLLALYIYIYIAEVETENAVNKILVPYFILSSFFFEINSVRKRHFRNYLYS